MRDINEQASYKNTEGSIFGKIGAFLQSAANSASDNIANIFDQERDKNDIAFTMRKRLKSGNYKVVQGILNTETGELAEKRVFEGEQIDWQLLD